MKQERIRTTLYLDKTLKRMADIQALQESVTLQEIFNRALRNELQQKIPSKKKKVEFISLKLDIPHNLKRKDYYES